MTTPTFDPHGYPSDETLDAIAAWPADDLEGLFKFIGQAWHWPAYCGIDRSRLRHEGNRITVVTGGWSGNELLISALKQNSVAWSLTWVESRRGGYYVFEVGGHGVKP